MQQAIVTVIVALAVLAVIRRYAPQPVRQACRAWAARAAHRLGWTSVARRLSAPTAGDASCADGCGPCKGCGPEAVPKNRFTISLDDLRVKK